MISRTAVLFDIDGTLADVDHRVHLVDPNRKGGKDWDAFFDAMNLILHGIEAPNIVHNQC